MDREVAIVMALPGPVVTALAGLLLAGLTLLLAPALARRLAGGEG